MDEKLRILMCEDDENLGMLLREYLQAKGYTAELYPDGEAGYKAFLKSKFDICVLDVMMPNMNGWDTLKAIRTNDKLKHIPVIMLTAVNEEQKIVSGLKIGADDYIIKPFVLPNLLARIEAILRRVNWQKTETKSQDLPFCSDEPIEALTLREIDVLTLVAKGANNQTISE